jgi:hypothetical protein
MSSGRAMPVVLLALALGARAAERDLPNDRVQRVRYLLNFTEYVEWPAKVFADARAPILIGIIGEDPFGEVLTTQAGEHRGRRRVEVRRFKGIMEFRGQEIPGRPQDELVAKRRAKVRELRACHVLYVSRSEDAFLSQVFRAVHKAPVLTVGDKPSFAREPRGGVIGFFEIGPQLAFEINLDTAEAAELKISSKLLALAKVIRKEDIQAKP